MSLDVTRNNVSIKRANRMWKNMTRCVALRVQQTRKKVNWKCSRLCFQAYLTRYGACLYITTYTTWFLPFQINNSIAATLTKLHLRSMFPRYISAIEQWTIMFLLINLVDIKLVLPQNVHLIFSMIEVT